MIAQRLAAVGELDARRAGELADRKLWRTDPFEEVAAEISAAQNISRGRARGQITERKPELDAAIARHCLKWMKLSKRKLRDRIDHLLKTFFGSLGWADRQPPDGTVEITAPTGHVYRTEAHGGALFPALAQPIGDLGDIAVPAESPDRGAMMPTRRQTREQDWAARIAKERRERAEINAEELRKHARWLAANFEPPPV